MFANKQLVIGLLACTGTLPSCGDVGSGSDNIDPALDTECESGTGGPAATSGGDHGPPYQFGNPGLDESGGDGGSGVYPNNGPDPFIWEFDAGTGIYYRATTSAERNANRWQDGSFLVADPDLLADLLSGQTAQLSFPLAPTPGATSTLISFESVQLKSQRKSTLSPVHTSTGDKFSTTSAVRRPTFYTYFVAGSTQTSPGDVLVHLVAEHGRGFSATLALPDRRIAIRGPFLPSQKFTHLDIAPPVGQSVILIETSLDPNPGFLQAASEINRIHSQPAPMDNDSHPSELKAPRSYSLGDDGRANQCADDLDNNPNGTADECDYNCVDHNDYGASNYNIVQGFEYTKNVAITSDISLCTCNPMMCAAMLLEVGESANQLLNQLVPPPSMDYPSNTRAPPLRVRLLQEFIHTDGCEAAEACDVNASGADCPNDYPFATTAGDMTDIRPAAWNAIDLAATAISASTEDLHPVSLVGTLIATNNSTDVGVGLSDPLIRENSPAHRRCRR